MYCVFGLCACVRYSVVQCTVCLGYVRAMCVQHCGALLFVGGVRRCAASACDDDDDDDDDDDNN